MREAETRVVTTQNEARLMESVAWKQNQVVNILNHNIIEDAVEKSANRYFHTSGRSKVYDRALGLLGEDSYSKYMRKATSDDMLHTIVDMGIQVSKGEKYSKDEIYQKLLHVPNSDDLIAGELASLISQNPTFL
jgi:hypothetical protein